MKKRQAELEQLKDDEEGDWIFDCEKCGLYGPNLVSAPCFITFDPTNSL